MKFQKTECQAMELCGTGPEVKYDPRRKPIYLLSRKPKEKRSAKKRLYAQVKHVSSGSFSYSGRKAETFAEIARSSTP